MKFATLLLKTATRNKRRTALTLLSVSIAVFLFATLYSVLDAFNAAAAASSSTRTVTIRSTSLIFSMPYSHFEHIRNTPGVRDVTYANWFGGIYKDPRNFFAQFAVDAESYLRIYPEIVVPPDQKQAFLADRTGAIIGDGLAKRFGWKLGDPIVLQVGIPTYGTEDFTFTVRAIYTAGSSAVDNQTMLFHWKYADERSLLKGQCGWFVEEIANPDLAARVADDIDRKFSNTPYETKTETEKAFASSFVSMFGNLNLLLGSIAAAVVVTTLFVAGNTMAMSVRERMTEIAVMRTLGFPSSTIFALVAGEAVLIAFAGGLLGAAVAAWLVRPEHFAASNFMPPLNVSSARLVMGIGLGAAIGLLAGLIPATLASRLKIVDALRRVA